MRTLLMALGLCGLLLTPLPDVAHGGPVKANPLNTIQAKAAPANTKQTNATAVTTRQTKATPVKTTPVKATQVGWASWYGTHHHGRTTASGERFSRQRLTAAHRSLPLGTKVKVTNLRTKQQVMVKINDRGPYAGGQRIIDLSEAAAKRIGLLERGVERVALVVVEPAS